MRRQRRRRITSRTHARRTRLLTAGMALVATAFASRAAQLQILQGGEWREQAWAQTTELVEIPAARGGIFDRHGKPLALSRPEYRAFLAPKEARDLRRDVETVAAVLGLSAREQRRLLRGVDGWLSIGVVDGRERETLAGAVRSGVHFEPIESRVHPEGALARSLVGAVRTDGQGRSGLELVLDSLLRGTPGEAVRRKAAHGESYPLTEIPSAPAHPGHDIYLTLDAELQAIAEQALDGAMEETGASGGDVLMADPRTGELLAVASRRPEAQTTIPAFTDPYEPGSTVKPFLLATLLREGLADLSDLVYAEGGEYRTPYRTIRDVHPHDTLTVAEVILFSSNIGAAKLSRLMGPGVQYRYLRDFGFGTPTGLRFPGESAGLLRRPDSWSALSQESLAFGYELMMTSLQLVAAYGALANEGVLLRPGLVREVRDGEGQTVWRRNVEPIRRVVEPEIAHRVTDVLASVVGVGGTAELASVVGVRVAGKTGTARIASGGGYAEPRYAASFVGYLPAEDPRLVILTKLEDPKGLYYGGRTAAPLSRTIVQAILAAPGLGYVEKELPRNRRERLDWNRPDALQEWSPGNALSPFRLASDAGTFSGRPQPARAEQLLLPDVTDVELRAAVARLHSLGLRVELQSSDRVSSQSPSAGTRIVPGATVLLQ